MNKRTLLVVALSGMLFLSAAGDLSVDSAKSAAAASGAAAGEAAAVLKPKIATYDYDAIPKDPLVSLVLSAVLSGSGQVYNKEYGRGIANGLVSYGSLLGVILLYEKWRRINTDTVHLEEADPVTGLPDGTSRDVYILRDPSRQVGLGRGDNLLLVTFSTLALASYVFGIIDSYRGAQRYNSKLLESQRIKLGLSADPIDRSVGVSAKIQF